MQWTPGYRAEVETSPAYQARRPHIPQTQTGATLAECLTPTGVATLLNWEKGNRTMSLFHFGVMCAQKGFDLRTAREAAVDIAVGTGLAAEDGKEAALRHFERGFRHTVDNLVDNWGVA